MSQNKQSLALNNSQALSQILRRLLLGLQAFAAAAPLLFIAVLYLFSGYAALHLGHWPQPSIDDPKFIASGDLLMDLLYSSVPVFLFAALCSLVVFPLSTLLLWRFQTKQWHLAFIALFVFGCIVSYFGVSDRLDWYFD